MMNIGDLVKYKNRYKETVGIIVDITDSLRSGDTVVIVESVVVSWATESGPAISNEDPEEIEVVR